MIGPGSLRIAILAGLLCGCGFHLRGDVTYPAGMAVTYIQADDHYTPFYQKLKAALQDGRVKVTEDPASAGAIVRIQHDETGQRVLSVSARNTPTEYDVFYIVRYSLEIASKQAVPTQKLALSRAYTYDETLVLGKGEEENVIRQALADDLVGVVTRRLSAVR